MKVFDIIFRNEGGERLIYDIAAESAELALQEAWRQYRSLSYIDNEMPPPWTQARIGNAEERDPTEDAPGFDQYGYVIHSGHCLPFNAFLRLTMAA